MDGNNNVLTKFSKLRSQIKHIIQTTNGGKKCKYVKDFMKIEFNLDDNLPLYKRLKLHMLAAIVRSVFEEDGKYYPQVFLDECLYKV